jgi:ABC-type transport system substrate-binding protein
VTSRDRIVVLSLVALLIVLSVAIGAPSFVPAVATPSGGVGSSSPAANTPPPLVYREGVIGRPDSLNPLTARTQAARDIVALVFSGLVKRGANGTIVPDLADRWTVSQKGREYTFEIRADATWQDGQPVTAADVAFTIRTLQDPSYTGPQATSWREVTVTQLGERTVQFALQTPLGGFLQAATLPILPEHLLSSVPPAQLGTAPFNERPIGSGPYRLDSWDALHATLTPVAAQSTSGPTPSPLPSPAGPSTAASPTSARPSATASASATAGKASGSPGSPSPSPTPSPTPAPTPPPGSIALPSIELHFYSDAAMLIADYEAGKLDAASGLSATDAQMLGSTSGSRLVRYPQSTFTGILLNEHIDHPLFRSQTFRRAALESIDRSRLIATALAGAGSRAETPIPPASSVFDPTAVKAVPFNAADAARALKKLDWTKVKGKWQAPKAKKPYVMQLIAPDEASNPVLFAAATRVAQDWQAFGFTVQLVGLSAHDLAARLAESRFDAAVVDVDVGLDPDLYPLFASSQTTTGGANVSGVQSATLDAKLTKARTYASRANRLAAFRDLQTYLGSMLYALPLFFRDAPFVVADRVFGPSPAPISDGSGRYWDVLTWRLANGR